MARDIFAEERKPLEGKPNVEIAKHLIINHGMGMVAQEARGDTLAAPPARGGRFQ